MAKKNFITGFDALLQTTLEDPTEEVMEVAAVEEVAPTPRAPRKPAKAAETSTPAEDKQRGRGRPKTNLTGVRATFIVEEEQLDKVKALAYWERKQIKDVVGEALEEYIRKYEKVHGAIKPL